MIHSVSRIVALITVHANTSTHENMGRACIVQIWVRVHSYTGERVFKQHKQVFKDRALFFL